MVCQNDINSTHKISCNFQNMVQLINIYHATQEGCMYNELRQVMGVVTTACTCSMHFQTTAMDLNDDDDTTYIYTYMYID